MYTVGEKGMFHYQAFGLNIASEFELFQLATGNPSTVSDVTLVSGQVTSTGIDENDTNNDHCQVKDGNLWLHIPGVVRFLISNGNKITIDAEAGADQQTINLYLLGSCMGAILQQRGNLVLHGNAIRMGNQVVVAVAGTGIGKSTLAAEFLRRGYQLLADDVCAIDPSGLAQPSYPYLKLWQSSIDKLALDASEMIKIREQKEKFYFPLKHAFCGQRLPVAAIYVLNRSENKDFKLIELTGIDKLRALFKNKYRPLYAHKLNIIHEHVTGFATLLQGVKVARVIRPDENFRLTELAQIIIEDLENSGLGTKP